MKKVLSIALAVLIGLTAIASLAIVDREADPTGKKLYFDSISISTAYVLADYALMGTSVIADPLKTYVANEVIFGWLKFIYNKDNDKAAENITVNISSDYATFPKYLNTGFGVGQPARAHFIDGNGILQPLATGSNGAAFNNPFIITDNTDDEEYEVEFFATDALNIWAGLMTQFKNAKPEVKKTEIFVGFNGVVKASTAVEGKIVAYVTVAGSKFSQLKDYAIPANGVKDGNWQWVGGNAGLIGTPNNAFAPFIDIYDNGKHLYRVYSLFNGAGAGGDWLDTSDMKYAFEYLVQPVDPADDDVLLDWAVGFQNLDKKRFAKITYRKGLLTSMDCVEKADFSDRANSWEGIAAAVPFQALTVMSSAGNEKLTDKCWENNATMSGYKFFEISDFVNGRPDPAQIATKNQLDSKIQPIMDWFGFTFTYYNATRDSDYEDKAGWKATKEATFKYFGAEVTVVDDDIPAPETGDASSTIVIVLAASALLAAAALFFVMKKARD